MDTKQKNKVVKLLAQGKSQAKIAKIVGKDQSTISRFKKNNIELIDKETEKLISSIPDITEQLVRDIKTSNDISKVLAGEMYVDDLSPILSDSKIMTKFMELSYKKQTDIMKAVGILPSVAPSTVIQNLFQTGSTAVISPSILNILGQHISESLEEAEVISEETQLE